MSFGDGSGRRRTNLRDFINYTVLLLSVLAQFQEAFQYIAFQSQAILGTPAPDAEEGSDAPFPCFWTLITCVFFDTNLFFVGLHLLLINYLISLLENVWSRRSFAALAVFTAFWTNLLRLVFQVSVSASIEAANVQGTEASIMA